MHAINCCSVVTKQPFSLKFITSIAICIFTENLLSTDDSPWDDRTCLVTEQNPTKVFAASHCVIIEQYVNPVSRLFSNNFINILRVFQNSYLNHFHEMMLVKQNLQHGIQSYLVAVTFDEIAMSSKNFTHNIQGLSRILPLLKDFSGLKNEREFLDFQKPVGTPECHKHSCYFVKEFSLFQHRIFTTFSAWCAKFIGSAVTSNSASRVVIYSIQQQQQNNHFMTIIQVYNSCTPS